MLCCGAELKTAVEAGCVAEARSNVHVGVSGDVKARLMLGSKALVRCQTNHVL